MSERKPPTRSQNRGIFEKEPGSGVWYVRYRDQHGRLHRERVGPRGLALKVYQKRRTEIQERRFFPDRERRRDVLFVQYVEAFLADHVRGKLRNAYHYEQYAKRWRAALKDRPLRQILHEDVARYVAERRRAGKAAATINRELAFLRRVLNVARRSKLLEDNPVTPDLFTKENNERDRFLTDDEERRLREAIGEEHWPKVAVALHTGFRRGNVFRLRWAEDVNFETGSVRAHSPKGGKDYRVPMNDELRGLLRALPSRLRSPWVFASDTGESPLDSQNFINRVFLPALRRARIENFHWHDLRHTFASRLVMAGVDLRTVQALMGHKTLAMTERYAHLAPAHKLDAVQRLSRPRGDTATGSIPAGIPERQPRRAVAVGQIQPRDTEAELSGGGLDRTADLGIMRPSL